MKQYKVVANINKVNQTPVLFESYHEAITHCYRLGFSVIGKCNNTELWLVTEKNRSGTDVAVILENAELPTEGANNDQ